jgi:MocE subfamily Rieske [2Fe-2S] domain protein
MRKLLERRNGPAIRDTLLWFSLLFVTAAATILLWRSWWAVLPYLVYSVLYATCSDSRWHESGHGTAFKTDWMNNILYEVSSFMIVRESTVWRWSHTRHHSDTIIVGRDPEIAVPRPPSIPAILAKFVNIHVYPVYFKHLFLHSLGRMTPEEKTFIPATEFTKVYRVARMHSLIYAAVAGVSVYTHSFLPLLLIGFPNLFGTWLGIVYGLTQHTALAENVLDHRLNCRTVYMNPVNRFLYLNMNYHIEHHMYPLVPYHALGSLHEAVKEDCPPPYPNILAAYREIIPAIFRQIKDPAYHLKRQLPVSKGRAQASLCATASQPDSAGWLDICDASALGRADVLRFDHGKKTYALCRDDQGKLYAIDGICTHGNVHLAEGLVKGGIIECSKHNGRFNLIDGSPARTPVCRGLATYPLEEYRGRLRINVVQAGGTGLRRQKTCQLRVVSNRSVSTFIKELTLEPLHASDSLAFTPGDYLQIDIPAYDSICFRDFDITEPFATVWRQQHIFDLVARNPNGEKRNNYSLASNQSTERVLRFNVRIATPPPGQKCSPGAGSSYIFSLKPGDHVNAIGPFGDFHIKPTQREMIYIGGGAGMAPLRAHLSHLLETQHSARKISFWYGARSRQEIFYEDYFRTLAAKHPNFNFQLSLSAPLETDEWPGYTGFIHDVVFKHHLEDHPNPAAAEYYLCGPPMMIKACTRMLNALGVPDSHMAYDEF